MIGSYILYHAAAGVTRTSPLLGRGRCSALRAAVVEQIVPVGELGLEPAVPTVVLRRRLGWVEMSMVDVEPHDALLVADDNVAVVVEHPKVPVLKWELKL